ncbi:EscU/YscU/HrcU family type III secretion system export apparatus switch protein [Chenggangzhangella methanolivorans]|uniref:EscU/YscU/HrcU family type III secretion system export apparatus switch protein n=1 Tax=Chenggangzhangella methanolivorans TaxID=1437009 RepID=UPI0036216B97
MNDTSEEKSLPASRKKLDDARKKGQVNKSQDLVAAFALFAATLYVIAAYPGFLSRVSELMELTGQVYVQDFASLVPRVFGVVSAMMISVVAPLLAIVAGAAILANMVVMRGFVFSVEPIRPNFDNINPAKGLQRVFSMRSVVELLKSIVKVVALAGAFVAVFAIGLQALMQSPSCGMPCVYDTSVKLLQPIVITAIIVFFVVGAIDVLLQRQLFLRDMRMTKTEAKREFKDMEGDPMIRRERRKRSQELVGAGSVKVGVKNATLLIGRTGKVVVGLRFVRGETPVPAVVCRAEGKQANVLMSEANLLGIPVVDDGPLAEAILKKAAIGEPVPDTEFQPVADLLVAAQLI